MDEAAIYVLGPTDDDEDHDDEDHDDDDNDDDEDHVGSLPRRDLLH